MKKKNVTVGLLGGKEMNESKEFWKDIIYKDGKLDEEAILKELSDYYMVIQEVPKVYVHITGGLMSKIFYEAQVVIDEYERILDRDYVYKDDVRDLLGDERE